MSYTCQYSISGDFPNQTVSVASLRSEVLASSITTVLEYIDSDEDTDHCDIVFETEPTTDEKTTLDGVVAAHQGDAPLVPVFCAPSNLLIDAKTVTSDSEWETVGGTITTVSSFVPDVTKAWGRLIGHYKSNGGGQIRLIRDSDGLVCGGPYDVSDTSGAWEFLQQWANQNQPTGIECFLLQARLNGATSLEMRYFLVSLFKMVD